MIPRYITAFEHQSLRVDDAGSGSSVTIAEADELTRIGELRPGFCERGYRTVRVAQYCGIVTIGSRILEILPKVEDHGPPDEGRGILLNLLRESQAFPVFKHLAAGHQLRKAPLLEVFIAAFFEEVTAIIHGGLLKQYQTWEEDLALVRGRIVTTRQFTVHSNRPDRVACEFDELTADNVWNRFLKAALRTVRPWIATVDLNRRWIELMAVFEDVDDVAMKADALRRFAFDRQATRYRSATDWAQWILSTLSPRLRIGANTAPGLLFDMNRLFESAVGNALRRQYEGVLGIRVTPQDTGTFLATVVGTGRGAVPLEPDLVVRQGKQVIAIADTKWKRLKVNRLGEISPSEADVYQMAAYAAAYDCPHITLIYPWHRALKDVRDTTYELSTSGGVQPTLRIIFIDASRAPLDLGSRLIPTLGAL